MFQWLARPAAIVITLAALFPAACNQVDIGSNLSQRPSQPGSQSSDPGVGVAGEQFTSAVPAPPAGGAYRPDRYEPDDSSNGGVAPDLPAGVEQTHTLDARDVDFFKLTLTGTDSTLRFLVHGEVGIQVLDHTGQQLFEGGTQGYKPSVSPTTRTEDRLTLVGTTRAWAGSAR